MARTLQTLRPMPSRLRPALAGTAVIVIALPVFVVAGWSLGAWGLAAALWAVFQLIGVLLGRLPLGMDTLGATGAAAFGRMLRTVGLMTLLIIVTARNQHFGLTAAILFGLAFSVEFGLSLVSYMGGEGEE
jgi:hypothetical protein